MTAPIVSDELWEVVEPLIPKVERRRRHQVVVSYFLRSNWTTTSAIIGWLTLSS